MYAHAQYANVTLDPADHVPQQTVCFGEGYQHGKVVRNETIKKGMKTYLLLDEGGGELDEDETEADEVGWGREGNGRFEFLFFFNCFGICHSAGRLVCSTIVLVFSLFDTQTSVGSTYCICIPFSSQFSC